jgi:hypothetical protein
MLSEKEPMVSSVPLLIDRVGLKLLLNEFNRWIIPVRPHLLHYATYDSQER